MIISRILWKDPAKEFEHDDFLVNEENGTNQDRIYCTKKNQEK